MKPAFSTTLIVSFAMIGVLGVSAARASEYRIEMLVFAPVNPPATTEVWSTQLHRHHLSPPPDQPPVRFVAPTLTDLAQTLVSDGRYRILWHHAWTEEALPKAEAPVVTIAPLGGGAHPSAADPASGDSDEVEGYLRFYSTRYLQLELDLSFRPRPAFPAFPPPDGADPFAGEAAAVSGPLAGNGVERFWLQERRRVKAKSLHYFDHPRFGAIVSVQPLP